jgi:hypothetical protein
VAVPAEGRVTTTAGAPGAALSRPPTRRRGRSRGKVPGGLLAAWGALVLHVLTFGAYDILLPIPVPLGQMVTQGSLVLALLLALAVNRGVVLRPSLFLSLLMILGVVSLMVSLHSDFFLGSTYRAVRLIAFVGVLWLLTPWWGRRDMVLLRCHRRALWVVLATVLLGAALAPGLAFAFEGRLSGVLWPIPPTQVAHYAAIIFGTSAVLWATRVITTRHAVLALAVTGGILVLTHTRTALLATAVALLVAGASLFLGHVRVRRVSAITAIGAVVVATVFASQLTTWVLRGQSLQEAGQLTGRTKVWSAVLDVDRPLLNGLFGSGMSDQSFNGLPIDSNWLATYLDQGWFGLVIHATLILMLLVTAATRERGPQRGTALFLIIYCLVASITETGLGNVASYTLDLAVAAALLAPEATRRSR